MIKNKRSIERTTACYAKTRVLSNWDGSGCSQQRDTYDSSVPQGIRVIAVIYQNVLEGVFEAWINSVRDERLYVIQQVSAPYKAKTTQAWLCDSLHDHVFPNA